MRDPLRYGLFAASVVSGAAIFLIFTFYERPGLGLGHFFYIAIILAALGGGAVAGIGAAAAATVLYTVGVLLNPEIPSREVLTESTVIRGITYLMVGFVTGYFAYRNRALLKELELLAERDALTGLPNTRAFERAINERLGREEPFALLVGSVDSLDTPGGREQGDPDELLRTVASCLLHSLLPGDEVARVGDHQFAVLTYAVGTADASRTANRLQAVLAGDGIAVTFGWAAYRQDGSNALSLYRAADERLYARRVIHRDPSVAPFPAVQRAR
jgi:diguanylate cyclase (GGDEF)-like protein